MHFAVLLKHVPLLLGVTEMSSNIISSHFYVSFHIQVFTQFEIYFFFFFLGFGRKMEKKKKHASFIFLFRCGSTNVPIPLNEKSALVRVSLQWPCILMPLLFTSEGLFLGYTVCFVNLHSTHAPLIILFSLNYLGTFVKKHTLTQNRLKIVLKKTCFIFR